MKASLIDNYNGMRYYVSLYKVSDGNKEWYRINVEDSATAKFAKVEFEGNMAREMAQKEFDEIVYGDKTPLQYAWM